MRKDFKDISNKRFGKLKAIEPEKSWRVRGISWRCVCDCGKETIVYGAHLRAGNVKSCGCLILDNITESAKNELYSRYKYKSNLRNKKFKLSRKNFYKLICSNCFYCGCKPMQILRNSTKRVAGFYNGIDRKDNNKDYTNKNCVSCCKICNVMKSTLSEKEWIDHMKKIIKRFELNG